MPYSIARFSKRRRSRTGPAAITDSFNRADNPAALGVADTGQTWSALAGTWSTLSNQARTATSVGANYNVAVLDAGRADCTVQLTASTVVAGIGISARVVDATNFIHLEAVGATLTLYRRVAGASTTIGSFAYTVVNGDVMKMALSGSSIICYVNNVSMISVTEATHASATKHGLLNFDSTVARYDDFSIT